jgi:predicted transcriptional regulator YdeE
MKVIICNLTRQFLACKVSNLEEVPEGMIGKTLQGGSYVKSSARGDLAKGLIVNHWSKIWKMDINRAYTADFEVFGEKAQNPSDAEVDFYVAIKE